MKKNYIKIVLFVFSLFLLNQAKAQVAIFSENWSSGTFTANGWTFPQGQPNWTVGASYTPLGGTSPNAFFSYSPTMTNYTVSLLSNTISAVTYTNGPITLDYLLQLNNFSTSTLEQFIVEYKPVSALNWSTVAVYSNTLSGITNWAVSNYTLSGMQGQVFQLRFTAFGANSFNINGWGLDNITVKAPCIPGMMASMTPSAFCGTGSRTLTATGSTSGYTWTPGNMTGSSIVVTPTVTTTYSVSSTNTISSCTEVQAITVGVTPTVSIAGPASVCATNPATLTASGASSYTWSTGATTSSIVPSPSATSVYSVTGNSGGCMSTAQFTLTTAPSPTISISGSTLICSSTSNTLTASGANSYTWNTGSNSSTIVVTPAFTSNYTVTGSGLGCTSSKVITVSVTPTPSVSLGAPGALCFGNSATLTTSGASTYTWSTGANTNSVPVSPTVTTTYSVAGTGTNGCVSAPVFATVSVVNALTANNAFICASSGSANLSVNADPTSTVNWYASMSSTTSLATGTVFTTPVVTVSTTYYAQAATSSFTNAIFTTTAAGNGSAGNMFDVVPATNLVWNGADMSISSVGTVSVEIWYRPGSFVGFESSNAGWTNLLTTTVTSPGTGTLVSISGFSVSLSAGQTYGLYVTTNGGGVNYTNGTGLGNVYVSNSDIAVKEGKGGSYFSVINSPRIFNGRLKYTTQGCTSPLTPVTVSVGANPTVSIAGTTTICTGQSVNLTASGASTYTWNTGANTATISATPTINTTYTVSGANGACTGTASVLVSVSPCTGINGQVQAVSGVKLYPNPNNGEFIVELRNGSSKTIEVTDLAGRVVKIISSDADETGVNLNGLANGLYYVKVNSNSFTEVIKVAKQ